MSPRSTTLLALLGVLLAGIPLPALTAARREAPAEEVERPARSSRTVYATLHCSGSPAELRVLHEGRELLYLTAAELATTPWEGELELPAGEWLELTLSARWEGAGLQAQAASLSLEPEGKPARQCTEWTPPGSNTLHTLFTFSW